jgi:hypothetical protein
MRLSRPLRAALVGAIALAAVIVAARMAIVPEPWDTCRNFHFHSAEWRAAHGRWREAIGRMIVRCHTFDHATRDVVYGALGGRDRRSGVWELRSDDYTLSSTELWIRFGDDDRVRSARVVRRTD